ncbi:hypothetical protein L7F22_035568 [Adiantum nelumboides]|nr:hypothetical protein [Adiantum nelumboides]
MPSCTLSTALYVAAPSLGPAGSSELSLSLLFGPIWPHNSPRLHQGLGRRVSLHPPPHLLLSPRAAALFSVTPPSPYPTISSSLSPSHESESYLTCRAPPWLPAALPNVKPFPAFVIFGDSLVDGGNNNYIVSVAKANNLPFGIDFPKGPTGRFTNGKVVLDVIAELISLPYPPPYLDPKIRGNAILQGVSYPNAHVNLLPHLRNLIFLVPPPSSSPLALLLAPLPCCHKLFVNLRASISSSWLQPTRIHPAQLLNPRIIS